MCSTITNDDCRLNCLVVEIKIFTEDFNLKLEIELQFSEMIKLQQQAQNIHQPGVRWLEDRGFGSLHENFAGEGDRNHEALGVIALKEQALEVDVLVLNRFVFGNSQRTKPSTKVLQVTAISGRG